MTDKSTDKTTEQSTAQLTDQPPAATGDDDVTVPVPPKRKYKKAGKKQKTDAKGRFEPVPGSEHSKKQAEAAKKSWSDDPDAGELKVIGPMTLLVCTTIARMFDDPDFFDREQVETIADATARLCNCYQFSPTRSPILAFSLTFAGCMLPGLQRKLERDAQRRRKFVPNEQAGSSVPADSPDYLRNDGKRKDNAGPDSGQPV